MNKQRYVQYSGGSNAQSSIIQFFDLVLGVEHRPTGDKNDEADSKEKRKRSKPEPNFIHDMRKYMPGRHARFLERVGEVANIRHYVQQHRNDRELSVAFDACLAMVSALRDKHIQIVSRYVVIQSQQAKKIQKPEPEKTKQATRVNLAHRPKSSKPEEDAKQALKGTGGSSLIPFLRQARDETGEPAIDAWSRRLLAKQSGKKVEDPDDDLKRTQSNCQGLAGVWRVDDSGGGLCLY